LEVLSRLKKELTDSQVGREVESIAWIIIMEISKDLFAASDDFSWLNEESKSDQEDALRTIDSEADKFTPFEGVQQSNYDEADQIYLWK